MNDRLPSLKKEFEWLAGPYSQVLQSVSLNLSRAFVNFFEGRASFPNFKSKHDKQSIQYPQNVKITDEGLRFPKLGVIKAKIHRTFDGKLKTVTVSLTSSGKYFASLLFDDEQPEAEKSIDGKAVGIDLGLTHFAITSDGSKFDNPRALKKHSRNLKRKQQKLSRKLKGSSRRKKARRIVARVHEKRRCLTLPRLKPVGFLVL
jgi:putative transposase